MITLDARLHLTLGLGTFIPLWAQHCGKFSEWLLPSHEEQLAALEPKFKGEFGVIPSVSHLAVSQLVGSLVVAKLS